MSLPGVSDSIGSSKSQTNILCFNNQSALSIQRTVSTPENAPATAILHFSGDAGVVELNITAQKERKWLVNQTTRLSVQNSPHCRSPHLYLATIPYLQSSTVDPITMPGRLEGKVAIVTGAGSGYGRGIAKKFVEEGGRVIIAELSGKSGEEAAAELNSTFVLTDVTKKASWRNLLQTVLDKHGQLDIVVNNAGATYLNKPTVDVTEEDFELCMNVNVKSIYLSTNVIVPYFLENKRPGCFIQISSTAALRPRPRLTWYNASKAAVCNASKTMAVEYGPDNIRFNCICPVIGITGMTHLFLGKPATEENRAGFVSTVPLGRPSMPADIANACAFLASDEAAFITGVDLEVDGGRCV